MQKLTDEQLLLLIKEQNSSAEDELFNRYKPLVSSVARSFFLVGAEAEDLIQEGMIGLYKATQNFQQGTEAKFRTFAYLCVKRQIQSAIKHSLAQKNKALNNYISLDSQGGIHTADLGEEDAVLVLPSNSLAPDDEIIARENYEEMLVKIKKALSPLEKKVLALYLRGENYTDIADIIGKNYKSVDNTLHRIKNKLSFLIN